MTERDDQQPTGPQPYGALPHDGQPHGQPYGAQQSGYGAPQPWPGQYPYGQPVYVVQRSTNGMAVASMVLGILWIYWIGSVLALVFGYVARQQIRQRGESGDGMAIAGIVLGYIGIALLAVPLLVLASR